ncbi:uncharacterized protein N7483_000079 [Penicillium malachiteum]|uniref:uncharacterized protein n=1 Tax=Penicillium malachiteum TaxID=1324776 RepID=UPI0025467358|nr:uncharacterized protein N7483_000079 [Penicillium malachiteum]KAJ5734954.1 hypothetical protein N7483_000079 [Penicillium malachiteum]
MFFERSSGWGHDMHYQWLTRTHHMASLDHNFSASPLSSFISHSFLPSQCQETMPFNETKIEIAAPPARVREILLDFSAYAEWHTEWIKGIEIQEKEKTSASLTTGDKLQVNIEGCNFVADILVGSIPMKTQRIYSHGRVPPVFTIAGLHTFHIEPTEDGTGTIFTQSETSKGLMSFLLSPSILGKKLRADYEVFNRDLKARAEA